MSLKMSSIVTAFTKKLERVSPNLKKELQQMLGLDLITKSSLKSLRNPELVREVYAWFVSTLTHLETTQASWDMHLAQIEHNTNPGQWQAVYEATRKGKLPYKKSALSELRWVLYEQLHNDGAWNKKVARICQIPRSEFVEIRQMQLFGAETLAELPKKRYK